MFIGEPWDCDLPSVEDRGMREGSGQISARTVGNLFSVLDYDRWAAHP